MYKCELCGFECASASLMMQHVEWCGREVSESAHMKKVKEAKKNAEVKAMLDYR